MQWTFEEITLTDEIDRIDLLAVCTLLQGTYWAAKRAPAMIERSIRASLSFGLLAGGKLIGFARVVTDRATVGYLCDVVISEEYRGRGLGEWMLGRIIAHPDLKTCRLDLFTKDAQEFYRRFQFGPHRFTSMVRYPDADEDEERGRV